MQITSNIGFLLLAIFLILWGITQFALGLGWWPLILGIIALISGIFILIGK